MKLWAIGFILVTLVASSFAAQACTTDNDCGYGYNCIGGTCERPQPDGRQGEGCCGAAIGLLLPLAAIVTRS